MQQRSKGKRGCAEIFSRVRQLIDEKGKGEYAGEYAGTQENRAIFPHGFHDAGIGKNKVTQDEEQEIGNKIPAAVAVAPETIGIKEYVDYGNQQHQQKRQRPGSLEKDCQPVDHIPAAAVANSEERDGDDGKDEEVHQEPEMEGIQVRQSLQVQPVDLKKIVRTQVLAVADSFKIGLGDHDHQHAEDEGDQEAQRPFQGILAGIPRSQGI